MVRRTRHCLFPVGTGGALIEKIATKDFRLTAQSNMRSEFRYEMAQQQRIILERGDLRRSLQIDPTERARSIPRNART